LSFGHAPRFRITVAAGAVHQIELNTETFADRQSLAKPAIDHIEKQQAAIDQPVVAAGSAKGSGPARGNSRSVVGITPADEQRS
jgi:hypothetical protein